MQYHCAKLFLRKLRPHTRHWQWCAMPSCLIFLMFYSFGVCLDEKGGARRGWGKFRSKSAGILSEILSNAKKKKRKKMIMNFILNSLAVCSKCRYVNSAREWECERPFVVLPFAARWLWMMMRPSGKICKCAWNQLMYKDRVSDATSANARRVRICCLKQVIRAAAPHGRQSSKRRCKLCMIDRRICAHSVQTLCGNLPPLNCRKDRGR